MLLISIVVPVYNVELYICKCIDSILSQTYTEWELLLIDDESSDNSGKICDDYATKDKRIRVIHKKNAGVGAARNTGLENCKGCYVVFLDSDDFCTEKYLENFINGLTVHANLDLVVQGLYLYNQSIINQRLFKDSLYINNVKSAIIENDLFSYGGPVCKLYKADIIQKYLIRFSSDYSFGEDTIFFLEYLSHVQNISFVSSAGYYYRVDVNNSLSKKPHHFDHLFKFAVESMLIVKRMDDCSRFLEQKYSYNFVRVLVNGYFYAYKLHYSKSKRLDILLLISENIKEISIYRKFDFFKFIYYLILFIPLSIVDLITSMIYFVRSLLKKKRFQTRFNNLF